MCVFVFVFFCFCFFVFVHLLYNNESITKNIDLGLKEFFSLMMIHLQCTYTYVYSMYAYDKNEWTDVNVASSITVLRIIFMRTVIN